MKKPVKSLLSLLCSVSLVALISGCAMNAKLYPFNDKAMPTGTLTAQYTSRIGGNSADAKVVMPDGEIYMGEFSLLKGVTRSFGAIYGKLDSQTTSSGLIGATPVSGQSSGTATGVGSSMVTIEPGEIPGIGTLISNRGNRMSCEFIKVSFGGAGVCETTTGALYRIHF